MPNASAPSSNDTGSLANEILGPSPGVPSRSAPFRGQADGEWPARRGFEGPLSDDHRCQGADANQTGNPARFARERGSAEELWVLSREIGRGNGGQICAFGPLPLTER
jgi:hypothetical protein